LNTHKLSICFACLCLFALMVVTGCTASTTTDVGPDNDGVMGGGDSSVGSGMGSDGDVGSGMTGGDGSDVRSYASVGEQIYLTGVGVDGRDISRTVSAVSQGSLMMGGGGCGSCHAADGRGGTIQMMMGTTIEVPDITYDELIEDGFTDVTIGDAIVEGLDEAGESLDETMPRWQMTTEDLDATIAYLKELSGT